jgi:hypothetical protein
MRGLRNIILIAVGILAVLYILSLFSVTNRKETVIATHPRGGGFAGPESCLNCHTDITRQHQQTPHARSSALASKESILGSFEPGHNIYQFNTRDRVEMQATDTGLYQVGYSGDRWRGSSRIDLVIGSGTKGQTFLGWQGSKLIQLPVSYLRPEDSWSSSPGNPPDRFVINRPVTAGCLNCHMTHAEVVPIMNQPPDIRKEQMLLGISCERCHGPSAEHVRLQSTGNTAQRAQGVVNPKQLSRQLQLDICAQCHSGTRTSRLAAFNFLPGDSLSREIMSLNSLDTSSVEVHGNQYDLLAASRCFLQSDMTCSSCHNPHQPERGNKALFSSRCISCHGGGDEKHRVCKLDASMGQAIRNNCIDCHMPVRASKKIQMSTGQGKGLTSELARTHFISIYPAESRKILSLLEKL